MKTMKVSCRILSIGRVLLGQRAKEQYFPVYNQCKKQMHTLAHIFTLLVYVSFTFSVEMITVSSLSIDQYTRSEPLSGENPHFRL